MNRSEILRTLAVGALLSMLAACGGGGGAGGAAGGNSAASSIKTRDGKSVTIAAHNFWLKGVAAFEKAEKEGWSPAKCESVRDIFEDAVDAQGKFAEAVYMQGLVYYKCGDPKEALSLYEKALRINSKLCRARAGKGLDALEHGDTSHAEREFRRAIEDDPQCTEAYVNLAIIQRRTSGGNAEALKNLRRSLAIDAQFLPAFNEMALLYLSEAADNKKKLDLAEVVCSQAQKIDANYAPVYNTWGLIDLRRDKIIEASAKFQKAFELDPKMFEAYMNFAQITIGFRGYQDAKVAFEKALALRPDSFDAQVGLGVALRGLEKNSEAIAAYEKAIKLKPSRPEPYYNLGVLWQDFQSSSEGDMKKAEGYYKQFLQKAGGDKRYEEAVQDVTRKCKQEKSRRKRAASKCIAGRLQNIDMYRQALKDMAEMEQLQKEAEAQAKQMEAEEKARMEAEAKAAEEAKKKEAEEAAKKEAEDAAKKEADSKAGGDAKADGKDAKKSAGDDKDSKKSKDSEKKK